MEGVRSVRSLTDCEVFMNKMCDCLAQRVVIRPGQVWERRGETASTSWWRSGGQTTGAAWVERLHDHTAPPPPPQGELSSLALL